MRAPFNIMIETPNYIVRTLEESDDMGNWDEWIADPNTARMLNAAPRKMTADDFKKYVARFDRIESHLLGIFRREDRQLVGMFSNYIDWKRSDFLMNLIIGDVPERKTNVRHETSWRVNRYFLEHLDLKFQRATTLATNIPAIRALEEKRWTLAGRTTKLSADGKGSVEVLLYTRSREVWASQTPMSDEALMAQSSAGAKPSPMTN
jgi:hypothetical protein